MRYFGTGTTSAQLAPRLLGLEAILVSDQRSVCRDVERKLRTHGLSVVGFPVRREAGATIPKSVRSSIRPNEEIFND